jgi:hypothetical protein
MIEGFVHFYLILVCPCSNDPKIMLLLRILKTHNIGAHAEIT